MEALLLTKTLSLGSESCFLGIFVSVDRRYHFSGSVASVETWLERAKAADAYPRNCWTSPRKPQPSTGQWEGFALDLSPGPLYDRT